MKRFVKYFAVLLAVVLFAGLIGKPVKAYAAPEETAITEESEANTTSAKAYAAAIAMGMVISKTADGIARQPEAEGKLRTTMMLGLVFVETVVIYALIVAILVVFVL